MTLLQAAAPLLVLWRSGRFDTLDIARVMGGGGYRRRTLFGSSALRAMPSAVLT